MEFAEQASWKRQCQVLQEGQPGRDHVGRAFQAEGAARART